MGGQLDFSLYHRPYRADDARELAHHGDDPLAVPPAEVPAGGGGPLLGVLREQGGYRGVLRHHHRGVAAPQ
jgi:hypothetical protein